MLLEALACGCPVVATDCPTGPREILGAADWGQLVPVDDIDALATSITSALDAPINRAACIDLVRSRHNPETWRKPICIFWNKRSTEERNEYACIPEEHSFDRECST